MKNIRKMLGGLLLGGMLLAVSAPALADGRWQRDRDKCERRISKAEEKLQKEIYKHGARSRQAEEKRRDLWDARNSCRMEFRDDRNRHNDRNWDDNYRR